MVENTTNKLSFLKAVFGKATGSPLVLPRMSCTPGIDDFPIPGFRRCYFLSRVCFAMTINKSYVQSVTGKLGIDSSSPCFANGQLYVALSRSTHPEKVFVCIENEKAKTKNVVYPEVLSSNPRSIPSHAVQPVHGAAHPMSV